MMVELKERFKALQKEGTLSFRAEKTNAYLAAFVAGSVKDAAEVQKKVTALGILRLKERHIVKIIDVMPKDLDSLRQVLSNEPLTIKDEDLRKILDVIPQ